MKHIILSQENLEDESPVIRLECRITSESKPVITWYHLETAIRDDHRHRQGVSKEEPHTWIGWLQIRDINEHDAGKYTIRVQNDGGEQFAAVFSYVDT